MTTKSKPTDQLGKLQTQHYRAHKVLDALGAPIQKGEKILTLAERIFELSVLMGVDNKGSKKLSLGLNSFQDSRARLGG